MLTFCATRLSAQKAPLSVLKQAAVLHKKSDAKKGGEVPFPAFPFTHPTALLKDAALLPCRRAFETTEKGGGEESLEGKGHEITAAQR